MPNEQMSVVEGAFSLPLSIDSAGVKTYLLATTNRFLDKDIRITTTTPAAAFTVSDNVVYCSTEGYVEAGSASSGIGTVASGTITNNTSGGTSSGTINRGNQIKIGKGYYDSNIYYTAQSNSGNLNITSTNHNAFTSINVDGKATVNITGITIPDGISDSFVIITEDGEAPNSALTITNGNNRISSIANSGTVFVESYSNNHGTLQVSAYPSSGSTKDTTQTIVSNGKWVTPTVTGVNTYYGKVSVTAANASLSGSTTTVGQASAAIANTNSINATTSAPSTGVAGADYWQIKATASVSTTPKFTPSLTLSTAGWLGTAPLGSAIDVSINGDTTGASLYIPKATFTASDNTVYCATAGYIPQGSSNDVIATIGPAEVVNPGGTVTITQPSYTSATDKFSISVVADPSLCTPIVVTPGYISSTIGSLYNSGTITGSTTLNKVVVGASVSGTTTLTHSLTKGSVSTGESWTNGADSANAVTSAPSSGVYIKVSAGSLSTTLSSTGTVTSAGYGTTTYYGTASATSTTVSASAASLWVPVKSASGDTITTTAISGTDEVTIGSKANGYYPISATNVSATATINISTPGWYSGGSGKTSTLATSSQVGKIAEATFAVSGGAVTAATAGYIPAGFSIASLDTATFANVATDGVTYTDVSSSAPVLISNSGLYINAGYVGNTYISLAKLVPDIADIGTAETSAYILTGHSAYNVNGQIVAGSMAIYDGSYTYS